MDDGKNFAGVCLSNNWLEIFFAPVPIGAVTGLEHPESGRIGFKFFDNIFGKDVGDHPFADMGDRFALRVHGKNAGAIIASGLDFFKSGKTTNKRRSISLGILNNEAAVVLEWFFFGKNRSFLRHNKRLV